MTPDPPSALHQDDPVAADDARRRLEKHSALSGLVASVSFSRKDKAKTRTDASPVNQGKRPSSLHSPTKGKGATSQLHASASESALPLDDIQMSRGSQLNATAEPDKYMWAVLYENQRGLTVFSTPYYSSTSLLPWDPDPFTTPSYPFVNSSRDPRDAKLKGRASFNALHDYPLPSACWRWVSKSWMIDMRSTSPANVVSPVQYDGFEYNWYFRKNGWRADVGKLSGGGYVRRRRWVRLMARADPGNSTNAEASEGYQDFNTNAPSIMNSGKSRSSIAVSHFGADWDGSRLDLRRCKLAMMQAGRDGKMLELWARWLDIPVPSGDPDKGKRKKQWTEDDGLDVNGQAGSNPSPSASEVALQLAAPSVDHIKKLLSNHGSDVFQLLIYPESRATLLEMLFQRDIVAYINTDVDSEIEFWSYTNDNTANGSDKRLSWASSLRARANSHGQNELGVTTSTSLSTEHRVEESSAEADSRAAPGHTSKDQTAKPEEKHHQENTSTHRAEDLPESASRINSGDLKQEMMHVIEEDEIAHDQSHSHQDGTR